MIMLRYLSHTESILLILHNPALYYVIILPVQIFSKDVPTAWIDEEAGIVALPHTENLKTVWTVQNHLASEFR
jgi:hypothetical protein